MTWSYQTLGREFTSKITENPTFHGGEKNQQKKNPKETANVGVQIKKQNLWGNN